MDAKTLKAKVGDICFDLQCSINALGAIHTAMAEGPFAAENFADALYFVFKAIHAKQKELQNLLEKENW